MKGSGSTNQSLLEGHGDGESALTQWRGGGLEGRKQLGDRFINYINVSPVYCILETHNKT